MRSLSLLICSGACASHARVKLCALRVRSIDRLAAAGVHAEAVGFAHVIAIRAVEAKWWRVGSIIMLFSSCLPGWLAATGLGKYYQAALRGGTHW